MSFCISKLIFLVRSSLKSCVKNNFILGNILLYFSDYVLWLRVQMLLVKSAWKNRPPDVSYAMKYYFQKSCSVVRILEKPLLNNLLLRKWQAYSNCNFFTSFFKNFRHRFQSLYYVEQTFWTPMWSYYLWGWINNDEFPKKTSRKPLVCFSSRICLYKFFLWFIALSKIIIIVTE